MSRWRLGSSSLKPVPSPTWNTSVAFPSLLECKTSWKKFSLTDLTVAFGGFTPRGPCLCLFPMLLPVFPSFRSLNSPRSSARAGLSSSLNSLPLGFCVTGLFSSLQRSEVKMEHVHIPLPSPSWLCDFLKNSDHYLILHYFFIYFFFLVYLFQ